MDKNDIAKAEKILYDMTVEENNWRAARQHVGELLDLVKQANKEIDGLQSTKLDLERSIAGLSAKLEAGHAANARSHEIRMKELQQKEKELLDKIAVTEARVEECNDEAEEAEQLTKAAKTEQKEAEHDLKMLMGKIKEAEELLAKLTRVGSA